MAFYISGPKLLFETTKISTLPNSTQQEVVCMIAYIYICLIAYRYSTIFEGVIALFNVKDFMKCHLYVQHIL
jgi:hypothetical protein